MVVPGFLCTGIPVDRPQGNIMEDVSLGNDQNLIFSADSPVISAYLSNPEECIRIGFRYHKGNPLDIIANMQREISLAYMLAK